jgi:hypothetical protein
MPDGEVGTRRYWIDGVAFRVFNGLNDDGFGRPLDSN